MTNRTCTLPGCEKPHRARGLCSTHYNQRHLTKQQRHPRELATCAVCGSVVARRIDSRYRHVCSAMCRRLLEFGTLGVTDYDWNRDAAERARRAGVAVIDHVDRTEVLDRDAWTCYLCGRATDRDADCFNLLSPTVDHVVPLSAGGEHSMRNVRCCCLSCNSAKQARISPAA